MICNQFRCENVISLFHCEIAAMSYSMTKVQTTAPNFCAHRINPNKLPRSLSKAVNSSLRALMGEVNLEEMYRYAPIGTLVRNPKCWLGLGLIHKSVCGFDANLDDW